MSDPRGADHSLARTSLSCRTIRGSKSGTRQLGPNRCSGNDAGDYLGRRGLDSRISRSMAVAAPALALAALASGLHLGPEPVKDALGGRIARGDHEQLLQCRIIRIDVLVVENFRIDQLLARQIAICVGEKIGIPGRDLGPVQKVD